MRITITEATKAPDWNTIQEIVREATGNENAVLTRIAREDRGTNYTALGVYNLNYATCHGACSKPIKLTVTS